MSLRAALATFLAGSLAACASTGAPVAGAPNGGAYANFLVGRVANLSDDHQAASDRLYRALLNSPGDPNLMDGVLNASLATGDVARVLTVAHMRTQGVAPASQRIVRAVEAMNAGRWREARTQADGVSADPPTQAIARIVLLWAKVGDNHVDEVTPEFARLTNSRPYGALFAFQNAMALDVAGRNAEALGAYATAEQAGLYMPPAMARHADLLNRTGARDAALAILCSSSNATNPELQAAAARVQANQSVVAQPLTASRGAAIGLYGLAALFSQEADTSHALEALTLALMLDPSLDAARLSFAEVQGDLHHPDQVRATLAKIDASSPYSESARIMEAWSLLDADQKEAGVALAQRVAATGTRRSKRALADIYRSLDRYAEAEPIYTALIEDDSVHPDWRLYFARGASRVELKNYADGESDLRRALEISPDQPEVLNYLGYSWIDRSVHLREGLAMIQRAAEIRPTSGAIIDSLGWAYFKLGRNELAVQNLEHAVELSPAESILNDHLGDAYWRANRRIEARYQWQRALALEPMPADRTALETKLQHGLPSARTAAR